METNAKQQKPRNDTAGTEQMNSNNKGSDWEVDRERKQSGAGERHRANRERLGMEPREKARGREETTTAKTRSTMEGGVRKINKG